MSRSTKQTRNTVMSECWERIKPEHRSAFAKAVNLLNSTMEAVREYEPEANYYQECESLHLMIDSSHDEDLQGRDRQDRSALSAIITYGDAGAW